MIAFFLTLPKKIACFSIKVIGFLQFTHLDLHQNHEMNLTDLVAFSYYVLGRNEINFFVLLILLIDSPLKNQLLVNMSLSETQSSYRQLNYFFFSSLISF